MQLNDFHVLDVTYKQTGTKIHRDIVYDDIQTFIDEIYMYKAEDYTFNEIPRKDWTIDDCINVTSELLKNTNHYSLAYELHAIVDIMRQVNIPENLITTFANEYMERIFAKYSY